MSEKLLPTGQAAKYLKISKWTLRRWVAAGRIKPKEKRSNGYLGFLVSDLDEAVRNGEHTKYKTQRLHPPKRKAKQPQAVSQEKKEPQLLAPPKPETIQAQEQIIVGRVDEKGNVSILAKISRFFGGTKSITIVLLGMCSFLTFQGVSLLSQRNHYGTGEGGTVLSAKSQAKKFTWIDTVLAAASDSADPRQASVQFLMTPDDRLDTLFSKDPQPTPTTGSFVGKIASYQDFSDSPYPYLSGQYGAAAPVAVIDNADVLMDQPFFASAQNGDKLLVYKKANRAILLRPLTNAVLAFAPLDAAAGENAFLASVAKEAGPTVLLRNGMVWGQDLKAFESEVRSAYQGVIVVGTEPAMRTDYKRTFLVDLTRGAKQQEAQELSKKLRIPLIDLPIDEPLAPSGIDFIAIVGSDRK